MRILVVGSGYVGLVSGACFAEMGHHVTCLDIDEKRIEQLKQGIIPIYEPGLEEIVQRNLSSGRLSFTTSYRDGVASSTVCLLAVPTPMGDKGAANLSYIYQAIKSIAQEMQEYRIIVNKSTAPIGTAAALHTALKEELARLGKQDLSFDIVANPEFLKEGDAVQDFMKPDRIIIGTQNPNAEQVMRELYSPFTFNSQRILIMDPASAEMTKYAANAMLATRISLMNELAGLCEHLGTDITMVRHGIGTDRRIGSSFLYAGPGYGGSCFPKDIQALQAIGRAHDYPLSILEAVHTVNQRQKQVVGNKILYYFSSKGTLKGKSLAIWGLAFKSGTDDLRESPALALIDQLKEHGVHFRLFDPVALEKAKQHPQLQQLPSQITWCHNELDSCQGVDGIVLMTEWKQFRFLDFPALLKQMRGHAFFDGRNQYQPGDMAAHGFDYISIGREPHYR